MIFSRLLTNLSKPSCPKVLCSQSQLWVTTCTSVQADYELYSEPKQQSAQATQEKEEEAGSAERAPIGQCLFDNKRRNTVMLTGKVMSDITLNKFTSGRIKASLSLGVDAHRFAVTAWGPVAQMAADNVKEGQDICVVGSLAQEQWGSNDSFARKSTVVVVANTLELVQNHDSSTVSQSSTVQYQPRKNDSQKSELFPLDKLWKRLFSNPDDFFDNRLSKRSPRAPDFKHKQSAQGLWLDSHRLPPWVMAKLNGDITAPIPVPDKDSRGGEDTN